MSVSSGLTPTGPQDSVAASLIQGAQALQNTHSQVGAQNLPDLNTHAPTDYSQVSCSGSQTAELVLANKAILGSDYLRIS